MNEGVWTIIYPTTNLEASKALFATLLGSDPIADSPYYVGFQVGKQHIGLNPHGHREGQSGPQAFYHVSDIKATMQALIDGGATSNAEPRDVGGGRLVGSVK